MKKSLSYKISKWLFTQVINLCELKGHKWKSHGSIRRCKRCELAQTAPENHYYNIRGILKKCRSFADNKYHNCEQYGHVLIKRQCIECGIIR